jgi:PmbA protein
MQAIAPLDTDAQSRERLCAMVRDIMRLAEGNGASACEAAVSTSNGLAVTVRLGEVETIEHTRDKGVGVSVYFGHRKGSASTSDLTDAALAQTVAAACNVARFTSEDECAGLADPDRLARRSMDLDLHHPWELSAEQGIEHARAAEDAARDHDARISNSEGATVNTQRGLFVYGNSQGFLDGYASSRHSLSCTVIAGEGADMQRDYWYSVSRRADALETPAEVGRHAARRTVARLDARSLDTCTTPVVYAADVARGLFQHLLGAVRGASQYRKASFLLDSAGKRVLPPGLRLHEQPHLPGALGSAAFDAEGVATQPRDLVSDGILQGYVLDSYAARKLGLTTTGNAGGVHNLTVEPTAGDLASLLATMHRGVLITELMGFGINGVTGDYSRGAAGYWVDNGEIQYPVQEFTVAGNLKTMLLGIQAVGDDMDLRGNIRCGSVLIDRMTIAGN